METNSRKHNEERYIGKFGTHRTDGGQEGQKKTKAHNIARDGLGEIIKRQLLLRAT